MPPRMTLDSSTSGSPISIAPSRWDSGSSSSGADLGSSAEFNVDVINNKTRMPCSIIRNGKKGRVRSNNMKKSVQFTKQNEIFPVEHLDNMTPEEISNIWYDSKDYAEIKSSYQVTIFMMETAESNDKSMPDETDEHTIRGLEYRTQSGAWARYEKKRDAYNAVLDEQDRQWKVDCDDHERLSSVYIEHSSKCVAAAYQRGLEDAITAREICAQFYKIKKSSSKNGTTSNSNSNSSGSTLKKESRNGSISSKRGDDMMMRIHKEKGSLSNAQPPSVRDSVTVTKEHMQQKQQKSSSSSSSRPGVSRTKSSSSSGSNKTSGSSSRSKQTPVVAV